MTTFALIGLLADSDSWSSHGGWGMGWMMAGMIVFWAAIILGFVWLVRGGFDQRTQRQEETAVSVLDRRFAEGAISADEYHERRNILTGGARRRPNQGGGSPAGEGAK